MTSYRRLRHPGASYFFTLALANRAATTLTDRVDDLRLAFHRVLSFRRAEIDAIVILPNHLHCVWTLPPADDDFPTRWRLIKSSFSRGCPPGVRRPSLTAKQERGVWQRRYWEHCIRDEADYLTHIRYCWGNPVKHGYVARAADWPWSSIHRDIRAGLVDPDWQGGQQDGRYGEIDG
ncbi:REP-associated tyrosine transposase [Pseudooceanicola sp. C21-150M6]|uniref:REP-associated tyrosine transposase n=1 Tax=Pseudooceanicola sp. C21-150M6 TaxID=3434355 RepID=UPI003D7F4E32